MIKGKFIVIYGINNTGKTTQAKLLVDKLKKENYKAEYLKYPIYNLAPTGPQINDYLRHNNPEKLTPKEIQTLYAKNREDFEPELQAKLAQGINIVAEDYTGTGLAWGIGTGVEENYLKKINAPLLKEDLAFLFDGQRFTEATEIGHKHETDEALLKRVRDADLKLAQELGWLKINANLAIDTIHAIIWAEVKKYLNS